MIGVINITNAHAVLPMGRVSRPRFQGPGRKRDPTRKSRMKMGIVKAMYCAIAPMLKRAPEGLVLVA